MKKWLSFLMVGALVAASLTGCAPKPAAPAAEAPAEAPAGETVKVGWIGALTGDMAVWGTCELNTVKMMAEEANKNGGWLGKQIEVVGYDTKGDPTEAVNATKRLVSQDKVVAIIGPNASGQAIAISQILEEGGVADIATVATNPKVTVGDDGKVKPYNFRVCFIDPYQGAVGGGYAADVLKAKNAAILYDVSDEYSQGLTQFFEETFTAKGGTIVAKEAFKSGDLDFRAQLSKIKESNPDVIFMPYFFKEVALTANQARELGITAPMMGGDGWMSEQLLEMAGDSLEGCYLINHLDVDDPSVADFKKAYTDKYGTMVELNGYLAYDAFKLLEAAVLKANNLDSKAVAEALTAVEVQGITGNIKIDPATHNPDGKEAAIVKIEGKTYKFQQKYAPK